MIRGNDHYWEWVTTLFHIKKEKALKSCNIYKAPVLLPDVKCYCCCKSFEGIGDESGRIISFNEIDMRHIEEHEQRECAMLIDIDRVLLFGGVGCCIRCIRNLIQSEPEKFFNIIERGWVEYLYPILTRKGTESFIFAYFRSKGYHSPPHFQYCCKYCYSVDYCAVNSFQLDDDAWVERENFFDETVQPILCSKCRYDFEKDMVMETISSQDQFIDEILREMRMQQIREEAALFLMDDEKARYYKAAAPAA